MVSPFDVPADKLIGELASLLKQKPELVPPKWASFVKTGSHKERPPLEKDWWYIRAASVLRSVCKSGPVGVSKLRTKYGGAKNKGLKPERFRKASGNIIRKILQQLTVAGLVSYKKDGVHKGRVITPAGSAILSKAAKACKKQ
jgi:small subunit ribosomal protein S19e